MSISSDFVDDGVDAHILRSKAFKKWLDSFLHFGDGEFLAGTVGFHHQL